MFSPRNLSDIRPQPDHSSTSAAEPMTLGSPVSSPSNTSTSQNYLPPYLFGEVVTTPIGATSWNTPNKQYGSPFSSSQNTPVSHLREKKSLFLSPLSSSLISSPGAGKSGGPPVQGLIYSSPPTVHFDVSKLDNTPKTSSFREELNTTGVLTPSKMFSINSSTHLSPAQIDPFFTQGENLKTSEQLDESWVTVFGFPPASATYILQQFSQYGNIVEHKVSSGNWMHIKYQSKLQAKKALSKNGKILGGNIMIGVKSCIEMDLMDSMKENSFQQDTSVVMTDDPTATFVKTVIEAPQVQEPAKPNLKNIRALTEAYRSPAEQQQVSSSKSGSIVSKAFQYIWKL